MNKTVKIKYDPEEKKAVITYEGRSFDTSRIDGKPIEEWAYPFIIKQVRWNGLFDELCSFLGGEKNYVVLFEGADADLEVLKGALSETTAKLAGTNNKVSIMYNNTQLTTKISVNGKMLDTSKIQNRSIDEWIKPIQFRDIKWEGIFKEIENEVNTDIYTIRYMGKQEDMKVLMDACPQNVDIVYGAARAGRSGGAASSKASGTGNGISAGNMIGNIKGAVGSVNAGSVKDIAGKMTQEVSDEEINKNLENIPIKNKFIRDNIMAICAALSIVLLLLPFVKFGSEVSGGGAEASASSAMNGFSAMFGEGSTFTAFLLLIFPVLIIVMNYIAQLKPYRRIIAIGAPALSIISEFIVLIMLKNAQSSVNEAAGAAVAAVGGSGASASVSMSLQIGFFLLIVSYILTAVVGFISYYGMQLPVKKTN